MDMTPQKERRSSSLEFKERQPNKPWKLSILSIRHIQVKTITILKSCVGITRSKLKTYAMSNCYIIQRTYGRRDRT